MNGKPWSAEDDTELERLYPDTASAKIAKSIGRSLPSVYGRAAILGLKKSKAYMESPEACRLRRGDKVGAPYQFKKGHVPANKGLRRPGWYAGRMRETQFKKGHKTNTWKPIGSERIADSYLQRKVTDTGYTPRDWKPVHVLLWIEHYGPIPKGYLVAFIDGDRTHIKLENLVLCHRRDIMRRNTIQRYPSDLVKVMQLSGKLKRKIERAENEKQD